jgi:hypothetical protein
MQCSAGALHRSCLSRPQAAEVYAEARRMCPYLVEDMAMYSSVLWHLRKVRDTTPGSVREAGRPLSPAL